MVRTFWRIAAILGISLVPLGYAFEHQSKANAKAALSRSLEQASAQEASALENYFERARSVTLISAHNPAFGHFYSEPGFVKQRIAAGGQTIDEAGSALGYLETLFPGIIGEACFIDRGGAEVARVVRGKRAPVPDLSADESGNPFFKPTFALSRGRCTRPSRTCRRTRTTGLCRTPRRSPHRARLPSCTSRCRLTASASRAARSDAQAITVS